MKILKDYVNKAGKRIVHAEIAPDEKVQAISDKRYYKFSYPLDEGVNGHLITGASGVRWKLKCDQTGMDIPPTLNPGDIIRAYRLTGIKQL